MDFEKRLEKLSKPDIILIITDQERATQNFPIGWEKENLHSLTFLKQNGFSFDRAFCNSCMCSPSRATLFTGTYPAQHNVTQTLTFGGDYSPAEVELSNTLPNMARMLIDDGYDVQYRGKWHLSKGEGENGKLSGTYIELITKIKPDFFLFENVNYKILLIGIAVIAVGFTKFLTQKIASF